MTMKQILPTFPKRRANVGGTRPAVLTPRVARQVPLLCRNHVIPAQQDERQVLSAESVRCTREHREGFGTNSRAQIPIIREFSGLVV
jgi:hypothetical protein